MTEKLQYDENSIVSLDWREGIRQNSSMYIGNTDAQGLLHLMVEIVANSIDEAAAALGGKQDNLFTGEIVGFK